MVRSKPLDSSKFSNDTCKRHKRQGVGGERTKSICFYSWSSEICYRFVHDMSYIRVECDKILSFYVALKFIGFAVVIVLYLAEVLTKAIR